MPLVTPYRTVFVQGCCATHASLQLKMASTELRAERRPVVSQHVAIATAAEVVHLMHQPSSPHEALHADTDPA